MEAAGNGEDGDRTAASEAGRGERRRRPMRRTRLSRPVSMAAGEARRGGGSRPGPGGGKEWALLGLAASRALRAAV